MMKILNKMNMLLIWIVCLLFASAIRAQDSRTSLSQNRGSDNYSRIKSSITDARMEFKQRYQDCSNDTCRTHLIGEARNYIFSVLTDKIIPAWYGTPWDFNGISRVPRHGSIACGCFIVFTLQDAGFRIPTRIYQQSAEYIVKNLASPDNIKRFPNRAPMDKIVEWIRAEGRGLYVVGLDFHVGYIIYKNDKITFCHSSYYDPPLCVVNQELTEESPLRDSNYRVIGKVLDDGAVEKWINGEAFTLTYDYFKR